VVLVATASPLTVDTAAATLGGSRASSSSEVVVVSQGTLITVMQAELGGNKSSYIEL
jgi:hypothetical protein